MKRLNLDFFFQLVLLVLFGLIIWDARRYPFGARFYPQMISGAAVVLLVVSLFLHFRQKGEEETTVPENVLRHRRVSQVLLVIALATVLGLLGGFLLSILSYYIGYALFREDRSALPRTLGIGVALTVLFYILFEWFMKIPLLQGWLIHF